MRKLLNKTILFFLIFNFGCSSIDRKENLLNSIAPVMPVVKKGQAKLEIIEKSNEGTRGPIFVLYLSPSTSLCLPEIQEIGSFYFGTLLLSVLDLNIKNAFFKKEGSIDWNRYLLMSKLKQSELIVPHLNLSKISEKNIEKHLFEILKEESYTSDELFLRNSFKKLPIKPLGRGAQIISDLNLSNNKKYIKIKKLKESSLSSILMLKKDCKIISKEIKEKIKYENN